jgi:GNAT superfamily N-acetyltransferase
MMTHNPPYYNDIMTALGFEKAKDLYAYYIHKDDLNLERVNQLSESMKKRFSVSIRILNMKNFNSELETVREIYNDAWSKNWGFVPMTPEEFDFVANDFRKIIDPKLVMIAEYKGKPIGFSLALPNYNEVFKKIPNGKLFPFGVFTFLLNKNKIRSLRAITLGVTKEYQTSGIGGMLILETIRRGLSAGYDSAEMSWVLEDNELMNKGASLVGGKIHKTYRVYQKPI